MISALNSPVVSGAMREGKRRTSTGTGRPPEAARWVGSLRCDGESTGIDQATAPLVHRLELRGLLAREVDPANHRRKLLNLTDAGVATLDRISPLGKAVDDAVLGGLPDAHRAALLEAAVDQRHGPAF
ncbi:MarR family winged helix-turn-helix transcriptional regulator [Streptomyces coeruleorubidus]|uniref:MarR family winged helix-turn-helix transcriptional regulator n=1 Tax=Streptomyces coeruleorubidus TaxID=116188 RepID=UPI0036FF47C9